MNKTQLRKHIYSDKRLRVKYFENNFFRFMLFYFTNAFKIKSANFHKNYAQDLQNFLKILFIGFRECGKTVIIKYFIIWCIVYKKKHFITFYCSEKTKAEGVLFDIATQLQTNKRLIADFGQLFFGDNLEKKSQKKSIGEFITENGVKVLGMGINQSPRGLLHGDSDGEHRIDLAIFDDIDTDKSVANERIIEKNYLFLKGEVFGGLSSDCQIVFLGNVIKQDGICPRFEKDYKGVFKIYKIPTHIDGKNQRPEKLTDEYLKNKRVLEGEIGYNQNYNLIPYSGGETLVRRHWIRYFDYENEQIKFDKIIIGVDPATSTKESSDPFAITVAGHKKIGEINYKYILECIQLEGEQKDDSKVLSFVNNLHSKYRANLFHVEEIGQSIYGKLLAKCGLPVKCVYPHKDKWTRVKEKQTEFEQGYVIFNNHGTQDLVDQLTSFPNTKHDDMVDSLIYAITENKSATLFIG